MLNKKNPSFEMTGNAITLFPQYEKPPLFESEKTEEIKRLLEKVKNRIPAVTECEEKKPFGDDDRIKAVFFDGEEYRGKSARVFAYIGFPENGDESSPLPAVVLVHGGCGHAYADWVRYWVDNGYAAIAFDGFGQCPPDGFYGGMDSVWELDGLSHPTIDDRFSTTDQPINTQWFYYYLSDCILAGNIMRADSRVDPERLGITGVSWGGYAVTALIAYDSRFAFAAPIYGAAYQYESSGMAKQLGDTALYWEPSRLLPLAEVRTHFFSGDGDIFFSADTVSKTASALKNGEVTLIHGLLHSQYHGGFIPETLRFANEATGSSSGNVHIDGVYLDGRKVTLKFRLPSDASEPEFKIYHRSLPLEYEKESPFMLKSDWQIIDGEVKENTACAEIPEQAMMYYFSVEARFGETVLRATSGIYHTGR